MRRRLLRGLSPLRLRRACQLSERVRSRQWRRQTPVNDVGIVESILRRNGAYLPGSFISFQPWQAPDWLRDPFFFYFHLFFILAGDGSISPRRLFLVHVLIAPHTVAAKWRVKSGREKKRRRRRCAISIRVQFGSERAFLLRRDRVTRRRWISVAGNLAFRPFPFCFIVLVFILFFLLFC